MWLNASRPGVRRPGPSLRVKLVAVTLCLLAAGAAVIVAVGAGALRGQLTSQAGAQLRAYVNQLTSHPFQVLDTARGTPVTTAPFDATGARAPGTASLSGAARAAAAASAPGTAVTATGAFSIELRGPSGQLLLSVGPGTRPGQALPAPFAPIPAQTGELRTVQATGGGEYLVIAEPVHLQARRLVFGYGADDFAVTGGHGTGQAGTLVVGVQLAGVGRTVQRLTLLAVAVSATAILIGGGLLWAAVRFSLRPVTRAAQTADAVAAALEGDGSTAADGLAQRVPERAAGSLARSLNTMLNQLGARFTASADAAAAARAATDRMAGHLFSVGDQLRRPVSLLHGQAEHWAHRDRGSADPDRVLTQIATHAARAEALLAEPGTTDAAHAADGADASVRAEDQGAGGDAGAGCDQDRAVAGDLVD